MQCLVYKTILTSYNTDYIIKKYKKQGEKYMKNLIIRYPALENIENDIENAVAALEKVFRSGGKLLLCGNGGSASDCEHIVGELMKTFIKKRPLSVEEKEIFSSNFDEQGTYISENLQRSLPAISLPSQSSIFTAFVNDVQPDLIYAQLAYGYGTKGDALIGITTSGNSKNIINAVIAAKAKGMITIGLTGANHCKLDEYCDIVIHAPETETYKVQEYHLPIYHYICAELERRMF